MNASTSTWPVRLDTSNMASASLAIQAIGFSHRTCLPASMALIDHSACSPFGRELYMAFTSGSLIRASYPDTPRPPCVVAKASAVSSPLDPVATSSPEGVCFKSFANFVAIMPVPRIPQRND